MTDHYCISPATSKGGFPVIRVICHESVIYVTGRVGHRSEAQGLLPRITRQSETFFPPCCFYSFFILLQVLRYTHAAPFHERLLNEASLEQSTNQLYPTIFSFPLASLLRKSIALHSLWFLNSVQHSMQEMFQRVVHILLISFPGVASLVSGYSRAAAASLGTWPLRVHLLGQNFPQATLACWAL